MPVSKPSALAAWTAAFALSLLCAAEPLPGATRDAVPCRALPETPALDGRIDMALWGEDGWQGGFLDIGNQQPAERQTRFKVGHDGENLILAAVCERPGIGAAEPTERIWRESVEFFVDPSGAGESYRHFAVNAWGHTYEATREQGGIVHDPGWSPDIRASTDVQADRWTMVLAIPFAELGMDRRTGRVWRFNVGRNSGAISSFARIHASFHQPAHFVPLVFDDEAMFAPYLWSFERLAGEDVSQDAEGRLWYSAAFNIQNQTGRFRFYELTARLEKDGEPAPAETFRGGLDAGQAGRFDVSVQVPGQGEQQLALVLAERMADGTSRVRSVERAGADVRYSPVEVEMLRPGYRDSIYATQQIDALEAVVRFGLPAEELAGRALTAAFYPPEGGAPLASAQVELEGREAVVRLPLEERPEPGEYRFAVRTTTATGAALEQSRAIRVLPPADTIEVRVGDDHVLYVDGEPFMPLGWFGLPRGEEAEALKREEGVNFATDYGFAYLDDEALVARLDEYHEAGVYAMGYPWPHRQSRFERRTEPLTAEEEEALRARVRIFRDHPAVLAYYLSDEPATHPQIRERLGRIHEVIADEDPYRPNVLLHHTIPGLFAFAHACDILMPDPYPGFAAGGGPLRPIEVVTAHARAAHEATGGRKPMWITPQVFDFAQFGREGQRAPNFPELRNMFYQAVVMDARGFVSYVFRQRRVYPELRIGSGAVYRELRALQDFILSPEAGLAAPLGGDGNLHVSSRRVGNNLVIFAVNTSGEGRELALDLSGPAAEQGAFHVLREDRTVRPEGRVLRDELAPYGTNVYHTGLAAPPSRTLAEVEAEIAEAQAALIKPGNLAHASRGTRFSGSPRAPFRADPMALGLGSTGGRPYVPAPEEERPYVEARFAQAETVGRVEIYAQPGGPAVSVLRPENGEWQKVEADVQRQEEDNLERITLTLAPFEAAALRLEFARAAGVSLREVEIYRE